MMSLGFLLISWAALRPWVAQRTLSYPTPVDQAARRALSIDPGNNRIQATLATLYHYSLLLRDYPAALTAYRSILRNNPLDSSSWLHLGKLYERLGQRQEADQAFRLSTHLGPSNSALLWEIAVARLEQEQTPETLDTLVRFLSAADNRSDLAKGYELARRLLPPEEALNTVIPPSAPQYAHYTNYLLDRNLGDQALTVWNRLTELALRDGEPIDTRLQLRVVDLLMATGKIDLAHRVWTNVTKQIAPDAAPTESNLVSNASFEQTNTIGRGFDWRIGGAPGVTARLDSFMAYTERRSLRLSFTKSRADFSNASQIIPVQPDSTYAFEGHLKTQGLDGSPGISLEIIDPSHGLLARTDTVGGTRDWTKVATWFRTFGNSQSVTLRIHGEPPPPYLPALSGSAWIDNVSLTKVGSVLKGSEQKEERRTNR
jgi:hypothetical protein